MRDPILPLDGHCRCGATHIRVTRLPLLTAACHCIGCQRMSASAFSLSVAIPSEGFAVTQGTTVPGGLHRDMHYFCPDCFSWMFTRPPGLDWLVNVRPTMLVATDWFAPFVETCRDEGLPWTLPVAPHSFAGLPAMQDYERLTGDYARAMGR